MPRSCAVRGEGEEGGYYSRSSYDALQVQLLADNKLVTDSTNVHASAHIVSGLIILSAHLRLTDKALLQNPKPCCMHFSLSVMQGCKLIRQ
jgi:hypothetical protein